MNPPSGKRVIFLKDPDAKIKMRLTNSYFSQTKRESERFDAMKTMLTEKSRLDQVNLDSERLV